jgi:hypothetical protein
MSLGGTRHLQNPFHVRKINPAQVAFDDFHSSPDQAAGESRGCIGELGCREN